MSVWGFFLKLCETSHLRVKETVKSKAEVTFCLTSAVAWNLKQEVSHWKPRWQHVKIKILCVSLGLPTYPANLLSHQRFPHCQPGTPWVGIGLLGAGLPNTAFRWQPNHPAITHVPAGQVRLAYTICAGT